MNNINLIFDELVEACPEYQKAAHEFILNRQMPIAIKASKKQWRKWAKKHSKTAVLKAAVKKQNKIRKKQGLKKIKTVDLKMAEVPVEWAAGFLKFKP